jgi:RNA polymerase sigma-70 factor (ECF subfamily)
VRTERLPADEPDRGDAILAELNDLAGAVRSARRGEASGWDTLFERFHPDVHAYALARLGDWSGAEDVTQEVFVAAVTSIRRLRDEREPAVQAWFLHICRHKVIDHLRRNLRQRRLPVDEPDPASDPQHVVEARLRADELRAALSKLTEDQRDILVRRFVLDHSIDEVASATGRSAGAVKSLQHRALATLGRLFAGRQAS